MADVKIGIDEFTAKLGSDALPPGAYSSDIRGWQWYQPLISEAHFNIKIVIPALGCKAGLVADWKPASQRTAWQARVTTKLAVLARGKGKSKIAMKSHYW